VAPGRSFRAEAAATSGLLFATPLVAAGLALTRMIYVENI